jgi:hypothetical protein
MYTSIYNCDNTIKALSEQTVDDYETPSFR